MFFPFLKLSEFQTLYPSQQLFPKTSGIRQISKLGTDLAMVVSPAIGKLSDVIQSAQMGATTGVTQISGSNPF
jgi:hypothetical protein